MDPSWKTIDEASIPLGRFVSCLVLKSSNMTSTFPMTSLNLPAPIIQVIFPKNQNNLNSKQYIQYFNFKSFYAIALKKNI